MLQAYLRKLRRVVRRRREVALDPDEVLLDAHNLPEFDQNQFEGRIAAPISARSLSAVFVACFILLAVLAGRLWYLQLYQGEALAAQSERNRLHHSVLIAERGIIYDRDGRELAWNVPGSDTEQFSSRAYIESAGFAHLLGYVTLPRRDAEGVFHRAQMEGVTGVEASFDEALAGVNGLKIVETDALGAVQSEHALSQPRSGENVTLALDARVNETLHRLIAERSRDAGFAGGAGVLLDVESGEIIALTSYPEYDPSVLAEGEDTRLIAAYQGDERGVFLNRAIAGLYTPGSIVKPFVALGALEEGIIDPYTKIISTGALYLPNPYDPGNPSIFRDWRAHGATDMREAIAVSSDVYFYQIGGGFQNQEGLGIERLEHYLRLFGLAARTGIPLEGEQAGVVPNPAWKAKHFNGDPWRIGNTYHTAIGQYGFQVTPLAMARAVAALAQNGILVEPVLVYGEQGARERLGVSAEHVAVVKEGMRRAVTGGTAAALATPYVTVAAKTGTAEVGAENELVHSWVVGFFPYEEPRYAFAVLMERGPAGTQLGAPYVMRQLLDWLQEHAPVYVAE